MAASPYTKPRRFQRGFTLLETLGAIVVLTVGLLSMAALMSQTNSNSNRSRYMSAASILASEKLEELNRYPKSDPMIAVGGATAGGLNGDVSAGGISYFDDVELSASGGAVTEVTSDSAGTYNTIVHLPDGTITSTSSGAAPPPLPQSFVYHRRWLIEKDVPAVGVRRITVVVRLTNPPLTRSLTFQMSTVRP
jgi:Tfp pilus assembly protein PilV